MVAKPWNLNPNLSTCLDNKTKKKNIKRLTPLRIDTAHDIYMYNMMYVHVSIQGFSNIFMQLTYIDYLLLTVSQ